MRIGPLGIWEILIILVVILLIFGPRRLPEMAKGIGQSVREFRKGIRDMKDEITSDDEPKKATVVESTTQTSQPSVVTTHPFKRFAPSARMLSTETLNTKKKSNLPKVTRTLR